MTATPVGAPASELERHIDDLRAQWRPVRLIVQPVGVFEPEPR